MLTSPVPRDACSPLGLRRLLRALPLMLMAALMPLPWLPVHPRPQLVSVTTPPLLQRLLRLQRHRPRRPQRRTMSGLMRAKLAALASPWLLSACGTAPLLEPMYQPVPAELMRPAQKPVLLMPASPSPTPGPTMPLTPRPAPKTAPV